MLSRWPIRYKLLAGAVLLFSMVGALSFSGFRGVYAYRQLARSISLRAAELPKAAVWTEAVDRLRFTFSQLGSMPDLPGSVGYDPLSVREEFRTNLLAVKEALRCYKAQLSLAEPEDPLVGDRRAEWETLRQIEQTIARIDALNQDEDWVLDRSRIQTLAEELDLLNRLSAELPGHLQKRMQAFRDEVRGQYHAWIAMAWATSVLAGAMLFLCVKLFYAWVFRPLQVLIRGSRRVAAGDFDHRIELSSHDEMAELAGAMNAMTSRFQEIRDELDEQVKQRTKEVVRSEQLASVGYLAAGVAHEINNPLASIAWSAESLESRLHDILHGGDGDSKELCDDEIRILRKYLRKIQDEAFRCKGITEKLLDFSRVGDAERQRTDLGDLVADVIDMVEHLGRRRNKRVEFECEAPVVASVNPQEMKQVVLNLVTNALDSVEADGVVRVRLSRRGGAAELVVADNGCGMPPEVLEHVFEPFYTRRRDSQGTGLGLSITYRIVSDHGGRIEAASDGIGRGSQFRVTLPMTPPHEKNQERYQAA